MFRPAKHRKQLTSLEHVSLQTQTHLLVAAAALAKPNRPGRNAALLFGAVVPDLSIYTLFIWAKINAVPEREIWRTHYWSEPWQTLGAIGNSAPLYALLIGLAWLGFRVPSGAARRLSGMIWVFGLAALLHLALDFPVHTDDAHRHFWPLSDWRFISSVSYYGDPVGMTVEIACALVALLLLWRRFAAWWVRCLLGVALLGYIAVPAYFMLTLGG